MTVTIIPATFIKTTAYKHNDINETSLVCGIDMTSGVAIAKAFKVTRANVAALIFQEVALGKDDSIAGIVYSDGTARIYVSSADVNASGSTSAERVYDIPGAFSPSYVPNTAPAPDTTVRTALKAFCNALIGAATTLRNAIP